MNAACTGRTARAAATYRPREEEEERRRKEERKKTVWELSRHGSWLEGDRKRREEEEGETGAPGGICRSVGTKERKRRRRRRRRRGEKGGRWIITWAWHKRARGGERKGGGRR